MEKNLWLFSPNFWAFEQKKYEIYKKKMLDLPPFPNGAQDLPLGTWDKSQMGVISVDQVD